MYWFVELLLRYKRLKTTTSAEKSKKITYGKSEKYVFAVGKKAIRVSGNSWLKIMTCAK